MNMVNQTADSKSVKMISAAIAIASSIIAGAIIFL